MTIGNGFAYALDLKVEARGLGQELDGSYVPLTSDNDQSPYSALTYIASIDKPSLHLEPGAAENVQVVVSAPAEAAAGTRYACVYINSQPAGTGPDGCGGGGHCSGRGHGARLRTGQDRRHHRG